MRRLWFSSIAALVALHAAGAAELSSTELKDARKLYANKCAKCHKFYDPAMYTEADWQTWMAKMSRKAKLKAPQANLLGRYFDTFRTATTNSAAPRSPKG